jgi:formiminotetrahydrofolate cyclodeaminase
MNAAVGAALVSMVCNLTIGKPKYAAHEETMRATLASAERARAAALRLADADADAFEQVMAAYRLPKDTDAERDARTETIQSALAAAADVPLRTARLAIEIIGLTEDILDGANVNVLSDVAVAASSARAALESAVMNVTVNLVAMRAGERRDALARGPADGSADSSAAASRADAVVAAVRERLNR